MTTIGALFSRVIATEQEAFTRDAQRVVEEAAHIAANPPSETRSVSGDLTRLSQTVTDLLRRAAKIEASIEALKVLKPASDIAEK